MPSACIIHFLALSLRDAGSMEATPSPDVGTDQPPVLVVPETEPGGTSSAHPPSNNTSSASSMPRSTEDPLFDQVSIQVPTQPSAESTCSSDLTAPNVVEATGSLSVNNILPPISTPDSTPTLEVSTKSCKSSPPHVFRTNIRGEYIPSHPLISKTAYESEV